VRGEFVTPSTRLFEYSLRELQQKGYSDKPLLLDPCKDFPYRHIAFETSKSTDNVHIIGLTDKGRTTIQVLGLNRPELLIGRFRRWLKVSSILRNYVEARGKHHPSLLYDLDKDFKDSTPYVGGIRQLSRGWIETRERELRNKGKWDPLFDLVGKATISISNRRIAEAAHKESVERQKLRSISVESTDSRSLRAFNFAARRIEHIAIRNLRGISNLDFTFPARGDKESWVMLIGENGVGKTSILQSVAVALMGEKRAAPFRLRPKDFISDGKRKGYVRVHINAVGSITLGFSSTSDKFTFDPPEPLVPLLAYGPTRLLPSETEKRPLRNKNIRVTNLFKPTTPLSDAEHWLAQIWNTDRYAFNHIARAICRLLLINPRNVPRLNSDGKVEIKMLDGWRRMADLSAGYRSVIALAIDIAIGTSGKRKNPEEAVGIVLLDEIESHLHPKWKISIVDRLRDCFPQMSFLSTTHDPLCLKGLYSGEIMALRRTRRGSVTFATSMPSVKVLDVDDILTSKDLFELPSSRNTTSPVTIARYSELLNKPKQSLRRKDLQELKELSSEIGQMFAGALNPMQIEVEKVIHNVMSGLREGKVGDQLTEDVLAEIRRRVSDIGRENC
jgi:ABC-type cobalamin/Fe3+-siderophores transport system ATPase subunit